MDPLSAISLASTIINFVEYSLKAVEVCREIRDDAEAATRRNKELEEVARDVRGFTTELECRKQDVPEAISKVALKCTEAAQELLKVKIVSFRLLLVSFGRRLT